MREGPIRLLVSAGEASGDHMLALVLRAMGSRVSAAGLCGPAAREVGATCLQDLGSTAVMGLAQALPKLCALRRLCHRLALHAADTRADAALLVGFTTFHERLGA
ncbi:MAG: hypothetical protein MUF54_12155, partial [Polyangiaceae bacterium]|nr:hypothetical protein [Polyangiaceae bacterium]